MHHESHQAADSHRAGPLPVTAEPRWTEFRSVSPDFVDTAPTRHVVESNIAAPRSIVWDAYVDPTTWPEWFPHVDEASYDGPPPYGMGTIRHANVSGVLHEETMVIWEEQRRWGYIINRATEALATAQLELTEFFDSEIGTRLRWTLACEPLPGLSFLSGDEPFEVFLGRLFDEATANLLAYLLRTQKI